MGMFLGLQYNFMTMFIKRELSWIWASSMYLYTLSEIFHSTKHKKIILLLNAVSQKHARKWQEHFSDKLEQANIRG